MDSQGVENLPLVLVTGLTGFIAAQLVYQLLETGKYRIRGTVRDMSRKQIMLSLTSLHPNFKTHVEVKQIQLTDTQNWPKMMEGVDFVLHLASPVQTTVSIKNGQKSIIGPCTSGTQYILDAAVNEKNCRGIVITSSVVSMINGTLKPGMNHITQDIWSLEGKGFAYDQSKLSQERIIQHFMTEKISQERRANFHYCTINPGMVWGESRGIKVNQSLEWIQGLMQNKFPGTPKVTVPCIDVKDVAKIHISAMEQIEKVDGRRVIAVESCPYFKQVAGYLRAQFGRFGYRIPSKNISFCMISMAACCDPEAKLMKTFWGKEMEFDDSARKQLGCDTLIPCEKSVVATAYWLIDNNFIPDKTNNNPKNG